MSTRPATSPATSNTRSVDLAGPNGTARLVTVIAGTVVGLTFLFGLGNVATLGIRLGVPTYVAILVAPAVDLSVVGLLIGTRHLTLHGGPTDVIRTARRLLIFASAVTLALNIAEPLISGRYGRAAFDAVGPLLLIGWAEVGPGLLQAIQSTSRFPAFHPGSRVEGSDQPQMAAAPDRSTTQGRRKATDAASRQTKREARQQDLLHRARAEDVLHWQHHQRPISAETLRKRLHIGAETARGLVAELRSNTRVALDSQGEAAPT
ncbi:hypothetical protein CcI49_28575 [Frankia sp. CcI49]|uniref:hypothetical protein n=1 Tax=Frankia sp. CcI49 TaxID=1745382 RepID=UPI000977C675|nr:hypothetical protein [Frankia sp. CcI49]ONH55479.1 hypothetical protein CcI49_28575 [Frankia sp. CcI49]